MSIDSAAVFAERVAALGLSAHEERFRAAGWSTYAELAFSTSYIPGQPDDEKFLEQIVERGLGAREHADLAAIRRLFFEAYSLASADLKRKVEGSSEDLPRKVTVAERQERRVTVERRLVGLSLTGELDISNRLLDVFIQLAEDNVLRYVAWEECTARSMEMGGIKKDPAWTTDTTGHLKMVSVAKPPVADTNSELKLHFALRRRGLAFEMADLMQYELHEKLVDKMLASYMRMPPTGHRRVDIAQLERADKEAFRLLSERTRNGIRRGNAAQRPLDVAMLEVLDDPDFRVMLQPLPGGGHSSSAAGSYKRDAEESDNAEKPSRRKRKTAGQRIREVKEQLAAAQQGTQAQVKGKGKGKVKMPPGLVGKLSSLPDGRRVCFNFNLHSGCDQAPPGSARLTAACEALGMRAFGVDHKGNRHKPEGRILVMDLTAPTDQQAVLAMLAPDSDVVFLWLGLPCGTMSRARGIPLQDGRPGPQPLRSETAPRGLPALTEADAMKVQSANALIDFALRCVERCDAAGIKWVIENPARSYLWWFPELVALLTRRQGPPVIDVLYDACMVGGDRPKHQRLRTTFADLGQLGDPPYGLCDGNHRHKPWGQHASGAFRTADEAEYPYKFCQLVASIAHKHLAAPLRASALTEVAATAAKAPPPPDGDHRRRVAERRAAAGMQPRGRRLGPLIPEFRCQETLRVPNKSKHDLASLLNAKAGDSGMNLGPFHLPAGTRILDIRDEYRGCESAEQSDNPGNKEGLRTGVALCKVGVPWSPWEFLAEAKRLQHPFQAAVPLPDRLVKAVFSSLVQGPTATMRLRMQWLEKWRRRKDQLQAAEDKLQAAAHPDVRPFLAGKSVLLFGEMLADAGVPNHRGIVDLMVQGVPMFEEFPRTGIFREKAVEPTKTVEEMYRASKWTRRSLIGSMKSSGSVEVDRELWRRTMADVEKGWLTGPLSEEALSQRLGPLWVPARRFPAPRDSRPIDDYSEVGHNSTARNHETADLDGVDFIVGLIKLWSNAEVEPGRVGVQLQGGEWLTGALHPEWRTVGARASRGGSPRHLLGRTLDLEAAFKQLARHPKHAPLSVICVWYPVRAKPALFMQTSLAFGARNSVLGFNWCGRGIEWILTGSCGLACVEYVDDYPHVEPRALATSSREVMEGMLDLVGWRYKGVGPKAPDFHTSFTGLGVCFDLARIPVDGYLEVANKPERAEKVEAIFAEVESQGLLRAPTAASLRGMLQFANAFVFGRGGAIGLRALSRLSSGGTRGIDKEVSEMIKFWRRYFEVSRPRRVDMRGERAPILLFTDASADGVDYSNVGLGGVMYDPEDGALEFFSGTADPELVEAWRQHRQKQIIMQGELFPVLVAREVWADRLRGRMNISFIDNMSAMDSLIKGSSVHEMSQQVVSLAWEADATLQSDSWYERVPSASNIADPPSRGDSRALLEAGAVRRPAATPSQWAFAGRVVDAVC